MSGKVENVEAHGTVTARHDRVYGTRLWYGYGAVTARLWRGCVTGNARLQHAHANMPPNLNIVIHDTARH